VPSVFNAKRLSTAMAENISFKFLLLPTLLKGIAGAELGLFG
jgi:hypothetical protein